MKTFSVHRVSYQNTGVTHMDKIKYTRAKPLQKSNN